MYTEDKKILFSVIQNWKYFKTKDNVRISQLIIVASNEAVINQSAETTLQ